MSPKVFGIGFHRTGTSSLRAALQRLGYRVCGAVGTRDPDIADRVREIAFPLLDRFDAFGDNPWPILFRELDERRPGSRFVLTTRPTDEWLGSVTRYFGARSTPMREWIYGAGSPLGNESRYRERYERHHAEVLEHFRDRPGDSPDRDPAVPAGIADLAGEEAGRHAQAAEPRRAVRAGVRADDDRHDDHVRVQLRRRVRRDSAHAADRAGDRRGGGARARREAAGRQRGAVVPGVRECRC